MVRQEEKKTADVAAECESQIRPMYMARLMETARAREMSSHTEGANHMEAASWYPALHPTPHTEASK